MSILELVWYLVWAYSNGTLVYLVKLLNLEPQVKMKHNTSTLICWVWLLFNVYSFILWIYYKKIAISFRLSIHFVFFLIFLMICKLLDLVICFGACLSCLLGFAIAMVDSNLWPSLAYYYLLKPSAWLVGILNAYCCFWKYFVPSFEERQFLC